MQRYLFVVKKVCAWRLFLMAEIKICMLTVCFQCELVLVGVKLKTGNTKKMDNFPKLPISYEKKIKLLCVSVLCEFVHMECKA